MCAPITNWTLAALAVLTAGPAAAQPRPPGYAPASLTKDVLELHAQCRDAGGTPGKSPGLVQVADLNGDGLTDYLLDINRYNCEGAASAMGAGQSGAAVAIYVGGPGNTAQKVFSGLAFEAKVEGAAPKARVWLTIQGLDCGQRNAASVSMANQVGCTRPLNWNSAGHTFRYAPLAEARR
jgi:hypothetical protein